jgi:hypothetical protein
MTRKTNRTKAKPYTTLLPRGGPTRGRKPPPDDFPAELEKLLTAPEPTYEAVVAEANAHGCPCCESHALVYRKSNGWRWQVRHEATCCFHPSHAEPASAE